MSDAISLSSVLDLNAAAPLRSALLEQRGKPVSLDAASVQRLGGLCLQVLLSGARTWAEDGHGFEIHPRSSAFDDALTQFGAAERFDNLHALGLD